MGRKPKKLLLIAIDTNVLMDEEGGSEDVLDALLMIRKRLPQAQFVVTERVIQELSFLSENAEKQSIKDEALGALTNFLRRGYTPLAISPVERGIASEIALKFQFKQIIPAEETNDATILAEAALKGCKILLTTDSHLLDVNEQLDSLCAILKDSDTQSVEILVTSPRILVRKYGLRR